MNGKNNLSLIKEEITNKIKEIVVDDIEKLISKIFLICYEEGWQKGVEYEKSKEEKREKIWTISDIVQLLGKIENRILDWDNEKLSLSLDERYEIRRIFNIYIENIKNEQGRGI